MGIAGSALYGSDAGLEGVPLERFPHQNQKRKGGSPLSLVLCKQTEEDITKSFKEFQFEGAGEKYEPTRIIESKKQKYALAFGDRLLSRGCHFHQVDYI
ncbi:MAG: hypothetical protein ACI3VZ_02195 [Faecousia sp.]